MSGALYFREIAIKSYMRDYNVDRATAIRQIDSALNENMKGNSGRF